MIGRLGRRSRLAAAALALVLVAAACSSDDNDTASPATTAAPAATAAPTTTEPAPATPTTEATDATTTTEPAPATPTTEATDATTTSETVPTSEAMAASEATEAMPGTIVEVAVESGAFPTLIAAVQAAGLIDTLNGEGPFTVLAPTEEAFAAALAALDMAPAELLAQTELLTAVLTYHVLPLEAPAEVVVTLDGQSVPTVNGASINITVNGDTVMINNATVVATDIAASNGIIHVIDTVLLPPSGG